METDSLQLRIHGLPMPKGSVTKMPHGGYIPAGTAASRMNFDLWKENIASAARIEMGEQPPWAKAIRLMAEFYLPVPETTIKKSQRGWLPHTKRPDLDKLTRGLWDPMKGIVWVDDSQVCHATVNKLYAWNGNPGAIVIIDFLSDDWSLQYSYLHRSVTNVIDSL